MTLSELKQQMLDMGATQRTLESKVIPMVMVLLSGVSPKENWDMYQEMYAELKQKVAAADDREKNLNAKERLAEQVEISRQTKYKTFTEWVEKQKAELEEAKAEFYKYVTECETPEGRDAIRLETYKQRRLNGKK